jgi:hypothetical protein
VRTVRRHQVRQTADLCRAITGGLARQRGSRNKLGEAFLTDVYESWLKHGAETLEQMRRDDPVAYVRVVANILPDNLEVAVTHEIKRIERVIVDRVIEHEPTQHACDMLEIAKPI